VDSLIKSLHVNNARERIQAAKALALLGSKGAGATRRLCEVLIPGPKSPLDVQIAVEKALGIVNPPIHQVVVPIVFYREITKVSQSFRDLANMGLAGRPAAPVVMAYWQKQHGGPGVLQTLAAIAPDEAETTALFVQVLLNDSRPNHAQCRVYAASQLPRLKDGSKRVTDLVRALRTDPDCNVRAAIAESLGELGAEAKEAIWALDRARADPDGVVRAEAEKALVKIKNDQ
jgi:HEAT repeat protein